MKKPIRTESQQSSQLNEANFFSMARLDPDHRFRTRLATASLDSQLSRRTGSSGQAQQTAVAVGDEWPPDGLYMRQWQRGPGSLSGPMITFER